jgi:hypothetical protein
MIYPSNLELLEFFGVEPERSDDVTLFRVCDPLDVSLEFSFNEADDSVQTALHVAGHCICVVCHERMTRFWIEQGTLRAEFAFGDYITALSLLTRPTIRVNWSGLRTS